MYDAIDSVLRWCNEPQPVQFPNGSRQYFRVTKKYGDDDLSAFERAWHVTVPNDLHRFLVCIGAGEFFCRESPRFSRLEIRQLDDLCEMISHSSRASRELVFANYLPIGRDGQTNLAIISEWHSGKVFAMSELPTDWVDLTTSKANGFGDFAAFLRNTIDAVVGK